MMFPWHGRAELVRGISFAITLSVASAQDLSEVSVGHWVELRGELSGSDVFVAEKVELVQPEDDEELIGTVTRVAEDGTWFELLGQRVRFDEETEWVDTSLATLAGTRVEVKGEYKTPKKFSAGRVRPRDPGRDRILGRVDEVRRGAGVLELDVMRFRVTTADTVEYERAIELGDTALGPKRGPARSELAALGFDDREERDDDDDIESAFQLNDVLSLGVRLEFRRVDERELDLDPTDDEDRVDHTLSVRSELYWRPNPDLRGLIGMTNELRFRDDDEDGAFSEKTTRLNEAYLRWYDIHGSNFGLQFGRQDFDERREWLWDENLDAIRLHWLGDGLKLEVAGATTTFGGDEEDEATQTMLAYLTNDDDDKVVGAYFVDRRTELEGEDDDRPLFYGLRAYGEWLESHDVWGELAFQDGSRGDTSLGGYAFDLGTTWSPEPIAPWYVMGGYAFGSGDADPGSGGDDNFRQTGYNDNNDKFGGVTSFRYYGEVFDPDLTNLAILTLGFGRRFGDDVSVDLVYHRYTQDEAFDELGENELGTDPNGNSRALGDELDLVVGSRDHGGVDLEFVLGAFWPDDAFDNQETAWLAQIQVRFDL